jgi:predicted small metal-binding protein
MLNSALSTINRLRDNELSGYKFKCKDIGMKECEFEVKGASSKDEVMQIATVHAKQAHKMDPIPPDVAQKVSSAIKS